MHLFSWNKKTAAKLKTLNVMDCPNGDFILRMRETNKYTPDMGELQRRARWNLFVCDQMMQGRELHDLIKESAMPLCPTAFTLFNFSLWEKQGGSESPLIPIQSVSKYRYRHHPLLGGNAGVCAHRGTLLTSEITGERFSDVEPSQPDSTLSKKSFSQIMAPIRGELYSVATPTYKELDKLRENGNVFLRIRVPIRTPVRVERKVDGITSNSFQHSTTKAWMYVGNPSYWADYIDAGFLFKEFEPTIHKANIWYIERYLYYVK